MSQLPRDPVIEEIREVRHRISERFNHDPKRLLEYYMRLQEKHRDRFIEPVEQRTKGARVPPCPKPRQTR
jgi:uridine kinase